MGAKPLNLCEAVERGQLGYGQNVSLKKYGQHDDIERRTLSQTRIDLDIVVRHLSQQNSLLFHRALAH